MNADEAWNAFQSDSVKKSGATISGKLDTLAQLLADVGTDTSRTAETVIPQLEGDQSAIDAANEQAGMGAPDMGAPDAGMPPVPGAEDVGAPEAGAPNPDIGAPDMGGADAGLAPEMPVEEIPVDDMGEPSAPEGVPPRDDGDLLPEEALPDMGGADAGMPDMGGADMGGSGNLFEGFSYTSEDALGDFMASITDAAHEALDAGDVERVTAITSFIDGVKRLWAEYMGGSAMPAGLDASQSIGLPEPEVDPDAAPGVSAVPDGESAEEPVGEPAEEPKADEGPAEDEEKDEEKDDDEKKDDVKKSECAEKSEDAPVDDEDAEKSEDSPVDGDDVAEGEGESACSENDVKKGISMAERLNVMAETMDGKGTYTGDVIPICRSEPTFERTGNVDMKSIIEEFRSGAVVKSSRAPAESAMGDYRNDSSPEAKSAVSGIFENLRKSQAAPEAGLEEAEAEMEKLTAGLRARRGYQ